MPASAFSSARSVISSATSSLLSAAVAVTQDQPDSEDLAYMARELVQCTLPHSDPGQVPFWRRKNGNITLSITSGYDPESDGLIGYPYGTVPRLILFFLTTEAVRKKSPYIELGNSYNAFIRQIGLSISSGGGKRSDAVRVRTQTRRLFGSSISFIETVMSPGAPGTNTGSGLRGELRLNMPVTSVSELWWNPHKPSQSVLWESWVELGEKFFEAITAAPVPVDLRALQTLKSSALALDLYAWATYKALSVRRKGKPQFVPWRGLAAQFGAEYNDIQNFRRKAEAALLKIQTVYPGLALRSEKGSGGITVLPSSKPAVAPLSAY